jgi:nucleotide-binding universal stress UspA family protein
VVVAEASPATRTASKSTYSTSDQLTATVLVALDGSDKDERAFPVAVRLAHLADGAVHLLRVLDSSVENRSTDGGEPEMPGAPAAPRDQAGQGLREAAERLTPLVRRAVTWEVTDGQNIARVLLARTEEMNADFVVMATRAPGPVGRAIRGSVADQIVREGTRPVILVPPGADFLSGKQVHLRRGLVPLDGSAAAVSVLTHLLGLTRVNELEFLLLEVVPPSPNHGDAVRAEQRLTELTERLRARGVAAEVRIVEAGDPAAVIIDAVRQELVDFIAMTTRGASGLQRLVLGSVATEVVRKSEVCVFLVTPG